MTGHHLRDRTCSVGSPEAQMGPMGGKLQEDNHSSDHYKEGFPSSHTILRPNGLPIR